MNWGPQANIGICTYLPTLRFLFVVMLAAAQWCPSCVQCFYIFHVHVLMGFFDFTFIHLEDTLFYVVDHEIAFDLPLIYKF